MKSLSETVARKLLELLSSFWLVILLLAVGWGPALIGDRVVELRPYLADEMAFYVLRWLRVTAWCSWLAIFATVIWIVRFVIRRLKQKTRSFE